MGSSEGSAGAARRSVATQRSPARGQSTCASALHGPHVSAGDEAAPRIAPEPGFWRVAGVHSGGVSGLIDPNWDFAAHYLASSDPDRDCPRLYAWHQALWGRPTADLPAFELDVVYDRGFEMTLRSPDGTQFRLASDGIIPTWSSHGWAKSLDADVAAEIAKDTDDFYRTASTIGGYILFPRNRSGQAGHTINQARGVHRQIADRFDLTLECIRLHYCDPDADNPLRERLAYYADFFALFGDFPGYVRHFLLDDLVTQNQSAVLSLMTGEPLEGFTTSALAGTPDQHARYRQQSIAFVTARNARVRQLGLAWEQLPDMPRCTVCTTAEDAQED
jgi:hypothetical protein